MPQTALQHSPPPSLADVLAEPLAHVNAFIFDEIGRSFPLIHDVSHHLIASGGKRLRPLLTLASAALCGYEGEKAIKLAACVEFLHTATLLHDDVVDGSLRRRGLETAHVIWNNKSSILVGDYLFSKAFEIMVELGDLEILRILSETTTRMAEGEVMQMTQSHSSSLTVTEYERIIYGKTACLFEGAMAVGARLAKSPHQETLSHFGKNLGMAFQMVDDALDYGVSSADSLGKNTGDDFREGKITLPFILALEQDPDQAFWTRVTDPTQQKEGDLAEAKARMTALGILANIREKVSTHVQSAWKDLENFPSSPLKEALLHTAIQSLEERLGS